MGGLWVDYHLQSTIPGLFVAGEANFSDHGANRLGASALMQGLADGYFVLPFTLADYLAGVKPGGVDATHAAFRDAEGAVKAQTERFINMKGKRTVDSFHRELGYLMWDKCGMGRNRAGLEEALQRIPAIREEFWQNLTVLGSSGGLNQTLEKAGRVADFLEFAELMCTDALVREESCGGHFREEYQDEGEAKRNDADFQHASAWQFNGVGTAPTLHKEPLVFNYVKPVTRSYK
jgi:succinate dehydrogenase / fumarate reductase flavoprotein subunit